MTDIQKIAALFKKVDGLNDGTDGRAVDVAVAMKLADMIKFLIPRYIKEGKAQLVIGIGCTGGHHRSVTIAEELYRAVAAEYKNVMISHRDIKKGI